MNKTELFDYMVDNYGFTAQLVVAVEELAELIKSITKFIRYNEDGKPTVEIIEEVADVEIMLEQLENFFSKVEPNYRKIIDEHKENKLSRLKDRIENDS